MWTSVLVMKHSSRCNRSVTCRTSTLPLTRSSAGTSRSSARRSRRGRGRSGRRSWRRPRRRFWHWNKSSRPKSDMLPVIINYSGSRAFVHLDFFRSQKTSGNYSLERVLRGHDPGIEEPPGVCHLQADRGKHPVCQGDRERKNHRDDGWDPGVRVLPEHVLRYWGS